MYIHFHVDETETKETSSKATPHSTDESAPTPPSIPEKESKTRHKSDSHSEVQKIFDKLKVSRLQTQDPAQVCNFFCLSKCFSMKVCPVHVCASLYIFSLLSPPPYTPHIHTQHLHYLFRLRRSQALERRSHQSHLAIPSLVPTSSLNSVLPSCVN